MIAPHEIIIVCTDEHLLTNANKLADKLHLKISNTNETCGSLWLSFEKDGLHLRSREFKTGLHIDFLGNKAEHRRQHASPRQELIAKACGLAKYKTPTILDATAGLGRDSFILASLGADVFMLERSPVLHALLQDALERLSKNKSLALQIKLQLKCVNAIEYLKNIEQTERPDIIYCDPMYPERKKSALVKKEMRILRELLGDDNDADELLALALKTAKKRVVVKRSKLAPFLADQKPDHSVTGKSSRFDVYCI